MARDVELRDVTEDDLPTFYRQQLDPEATHMAAFPSRNLKNFMAHWARILDDPANLTKTILFDGHVAGNIASFEQEGLREVGYWIGKEYWGRGIATQALGALLEHEKRRPLYAHVVKHNVASRRVLEKCGFTVCGSDKVPDLEGGGEIEEVILRLG